MLKFVYKICPVIVMYVDEGVKGFAGYSYGPLVKIKKSYKDDVGLLEHELTHSRQFYRYLGTWGLFYLSAKFRYKFEFEAYKVQLSFAGEGERDRLADKFAVFICTKYGLSDSLNVTTIATLLKE